MFFSRHVVLGLIFLKYISDAFEELYATLKADEGEYAGADPEDKDEYKAENFEHFNQQLNHASRGVELSAFFAFYQSKFTKEIFKKEIGVKNPLCMILVKSVL
jgi:type I restriction-modification system DNA methylase subunit